MGTKEVHYADIKKCVEEKSTFKKPKIKEFGGVWKVNQKRIKDELIGRQWSKEARASTRIEIAKRHTNEETHGRKGDPRGRQVKSSTDGLKTTSPNDAPEKGGN